MKNAGPLGEKGALLTRKEGSPGVLGSDVLG